MARALLTSPSGAQRLAEACAWLSGRRSNERVTVLSASADAGSLLVRSLARRRTATFTWRRTTLGHAALSLAQPSLAADGLTYLGASSAVALCARALATLGEERKLGRFDPVARLPGFLPAVTQTITELRRSGLRWGAVQAQSPDVATILRRFEELLVRHGLADDATILARAASAAQTGALPSSTAGLSLLGCPLLLFDVPVACRLEQAFVANLAQRSGDVFAATPTGDDTSLGHLRAALEVEPVAMAPRAADPTADTALDRLQRGLFSGDPGALGDLGEHVRVLSAPGESRECVELARAICLEAARGVAFDRMGILLRAPDTYRSHVKEALHRAGIPAHFARGSLAPDASGSAILTLLLCAAERPSAQRIAEYVALREACDGNDGPLPDGHVRGLLDQLGSLPQEASWGVWLQEIASLAATTLPSHERVLEAVSGLLPLSGLGPVPLAEVCRVLQPLLTTSVTSSTDRPDGKVTVVPIDRAQGLVFDVVFAPGLAEKLFPTKVTEDPILRDRERAALGIATRSDRILDERLRLRRVVGAARERLVVSYPRIEVDQARPRVPSFYALEIVRAASGTMLSFEELGQMAEAAGAARIGWPAPLLPGRAIDNAEYDLAILKRIFELPKTETVGTARYLLQANRHLARSLRSRAKRWTTPSWLSSDGLVDPTGLARQALDAVSADALAKVSEGELRAFLACPYRFFLMAIQRLGPEPEAAGEARPEAASGLRQALRGALNHGFFPAAPEAGACAACAFCPVCGPYEEVRARKKSPNRLAPLLRLRDLSR